MTYSVPKYLRSTFEENTRNKRALREERFAIMRKCLAEGLTQAEIAERLGLSRCTVKDMVRADRERRQAQATEVAS